MIEFWRAGSGYIGVEAVRAAEAEGWDGQMFQDSLTLSPNPYVLMGAAATATDRIRFSTGVTNPLTRHVAVTAAGAAGLQLVSGGRAVLGIGRGGLAPVALAAFEHALNDLQALLGGGKIVAPLLDTPSGLEWLPGDLPKVPLDVAASGPHVIGMAARIAERVTFSVGAIPERIDWAIGVARAARARAGLTDAGVSYGAQLIVICHPERETALRFARFAVPGLARFQMIQGQAPGPVSPDDAHDFGALQRGYETAKRDKAVAGNLGGALTPEFLQRFAIVGPPEVCVERLLQLVDRGIERFVVVGPGYFPEAGGATRSLFATEVMPAVRAAVGV